MSARSWFSVKRMMGDASPAGMNMSVVAFMLEPGTTDEPDEHR